MVEKIIEFKESLHKTKKNERLFELWLQLKNGKKEYIFYKRNEKGHFQFFDIPLHSTLNTEEVEDLAKVWLNKKEIRIKTFFF
jgi:hypothetical protein